MKKHWISIKRGLSEDPKHREAMGMAVWLFMHMCDAADWETGLVYDWRDKEVAIDMTLSTNTAREWRQRLVEKGYITCKQKQYSIEIEIQKWVNPRDYSGEIINNQGKLQTQPSKKRGKKESQGKPQVEGQALHPITINPDPFIESKSESESIQLDKPKTKKPDLMDGILEAAGISEKIRDATNFFEQAFGFASLPWDSSSAWRKFQRWVTDQSNDLGIFKDYAEWRDGAGKYHAMSNNKIRQNPQMFMDTGFPTFLAHASMQTSPAPHPEYKRFVPDNTTQYLQSTENLPKPRLK